MVFPVVMYGCESWTMKKAGYQRIDASELSCWRRFLRVPWTARRSNQPKGNQPWIFIGRTDDEAEAPMLWPPDGKSWLPGKDLCAQKDWQQEKGTTEDKMVKWHHRLNGHEFEQAPGDGEGQGSHGVINNQTQLTTEERTITTHKLFWTKVTKRLLK